MSTALHATPPAIDPSEATLILPAETDRSSWLAIRRTGLGSSDISALVGLNQYRSSYELYQDKAGHLPLIDEWPSEAAEMGTLLESVVRDRFARVHDLKVHQVGTLRSTRWPWMLANPDGICSDGAGYEGKTASQWLGHEWDDEQVPDHAELQAQWCMAVTGLHSWHVAVLIGGQHNEYRLVERDPDLIEQLVDISRRFWHDHVLADQPPPLDGSDSVTALLSDRYPTADEDTIADIDQDLADRLIAERDKAAQAEKDAKADHDAVKNRVRALIGDRERLMTGQRQIATWKQIDALDEKRLTAEHPDLAAAYTRPVSRTCFDVAAFKADHPQTYRTYRRRQLRFT